MGLHRRARAEARWGLRRDTVRQEWTEAAGWPVAVAAARGVFACLLPLAAGAADDDRAIRVAVAPVDGRELRAGASARATVSVSDPASGFALTGLTPALWLVPDNGDNGGARCEQLVNRLAGSAVTPEGTVDVNGFDVVQATADGRLALVDPLLNLASANIKAIIDVGSVPVGWSLDRMGRRLAVATALDRSVRIIDMGGFTVEKHQQLDADPVAVADSGAGFWIGTADGSAIPVSRAGALGAAVKVGGGPVALSATGDAVAAVARTGEGAFLRDGRGPVRFSTGTEISSIAFAPLSDSLYALATGGDTLLVIPQDRPGAVTRIPLENKARGLSIDPHGRWLALVAADGLAVTIFDIARNRARWTIAARDPLIAADFSDAFLYLVHARQGGATRVVFDPAGGPPATVTIAAGSSKDVEQRSGALPVMARIPQAGMLIASSRDRAAYMVNDDNAQAAMSSLPLRAGEPAGIILRYRGLGPGSQRGEYQAEVVVPRGGKYVAVVRTEKPGIAHCAPITVAAADGESTPAAASAPTAAIARRLVTASTLAPGRQTIRFEISGTPPASLRGATLVGTGWQLTPSEISSAGAAWLMSADLEAGRAFTLFVQYQDTSGGGILSAAVEVGNR